MNLEINLFYNIEIENSGVQNKDRISILGNNLKNGGHKK